MTFIIISALIAFLLACKMWLNRPKIQASEIFLVLIAATLGTWFIVGYLMTKLLDRTYRENKYSIRTIGYW